MAYTVIQNGDGLASSRLFAPLSEAWARSHYELLPQNAMARDGRHAKCMAAGVDGDDIE